MSKKEYKSIVIPESLYEQLVQFVEDSQGRYVSISEVVREAIWVYLKKRGFAKHEDSAGG